MRVSINLRVRGKAGRPQRYLQDTNLHPDITKIYERNLTRDPSGAATKCVVLAMNAHP